MKRILHEFNYNKDCPEGQETKNGSDKKTTIEGSIGKMECDYEIIVDIRGNLKKVLLVKIEEILDSSFLPVFFLVAWIA